MFPLLNNAKLRHMQKEDCDCVGVDVSKRTLDVALYRGEVDWKNGHIKVENNKTGYKDLKRWFRSNGIKKQKVYGWRVKVLCITWLIRIVCIILSLL